MNIVTLKPIKIATYPSGLVQAPANQATIEAYNDNVENYVATTPQSHKQKPSDMTKWIDYSISLVPKGGSILEIGSATPRDAHYMRERGYSVQCSDATPGFNTYLNDHGEHSLTLDILRDPIDDGYDMIFANAVVPHFTKNDFEYVLYKIYNNLKPGKIFAFSTKEGNGEAWIEEKFDAKRYTKYWQAQEIKVLVEKYGFTVRYAKTAIGDFSDYNWIMITAQKTNE